VCEAGLTHKILGLVMVGQQAKFSSSS